MNILWKSLILILAVGAGVFLVIAFDAGGFIPFIARAEPVPVVAFNRHRDEIIRYVESVNAGRVPMRKGDPVGGYEILDKLRPYGLTAVLKSDDGSVQFVFESLPCDPTPALVFCPSSRLDIRRITPIGGDAITEGKLLAPNWFYYLAQ